MTVIVKINEGTIKKLINKAQESLPNETGGVLVGFRSDKPNVLEYTITAALCITEGDAFNGKYKATPDSFECMDRKTWAELSLKAVKLYGLYYIGDWHSHTCSLSESCFSIRDIEHVEKQLILGQFPSSLPLHLVVSTVMTNQILAFVAMPNMLICLIPEVIY